MGIYIYDVYNNSNIGIFCRASEDYLLVPQGYARPKSERLAGLIGAKPLFSSVGYTRLLGPLIVINSNGMLVSRFAVDEEVQQLRSVTGLSVERFVSTYSAVGNLVCLNDYGAVVSNALEERSLEQVKRVMGVKVTQMNVADMIQVGSIVCCSNKGALVHPRCTDAELKELSNALRVDCEVGSINGGVPFVSSGILVNSKGAIVGTQTTGPELFILTKAFKL